MAIAALEQLQAWRVPRVATALSGITATIAEHATTLGLHPLPGDQRGPHLLGVRLPDAVRAAVVPALAAASCFAAVRGEVLRIAPHLHVNDADVARLTDALERVLER
jgi:acetylornithine/succinyldiaminopimelate/putrescine aminotransferase